MPLSQLLDRWLGQELIGKLMDADRNKLKSLLVVQSCGHACTMTYSNQSLLDLVNRYSTSTNR
jgi:hypothetical protein